MSRDTQTKLSNKKRELETRNKKKNEESSDDGSFYTDDSNDEMDVHEYRKFLKNIFPSKHLDKKIKAGERLKQTIKDEDDSEDDDEDNKKYKKHKSKKINKIRKETTNKKLQKGKKKIVESESEYENENDSEQDSEYDSESESESEYESKSDKGKKPKKENFNIIFNISEKSKNNDEDEYGDDYEDEWETETGSDTENEDDPISSSESEDEEPKKDNKKQKLNVKTLSVKTLNTEKLNTEKLNVEKISVEELNENQADSENIILKLKELVCKNPNDKSIEKCLEMYETSVKKINNKKEKKLKKEKDRNSRIFKKILRDKNTMNDFEFYSKLDIEQQKKIIKELREINKISRVEKPYRLTLLESNIPVIFKASAMKKISSLRYMEPGSGEFYKIKNWVDTFMRIPFNNFRTLPLSFDDGVENCHQFMENAQKTLDDAVYGLNDAKMQIMQMLGQLITNPTSVGTAIAIHGPAGTGKTTLVKEGISKILDRPFAFIALGGATDSSFLEGHGYTYEGSTWGKIVQILIDSKCMNPVIYFDELDKISDTPKGEEITGILTHLTDTTQNMQFHDKYFTDVDFDLSKCLFIFSYNDESKVNPILKDRMYRIQTKGYNQKQKTVISNSYLLPKIREQVKFQPEDIIINEQTIHHIIEYYCNKEDGVRNLKRCLEIIYTKLNLYRLMRPDSNLFEEEMSLKVTFPFNVTKDIVDKLVKKTDNGLSPSLYHLYT
jgi:ATP-dependent Lon protease